MPRGVVYVGLLLAAALLSGCGDTDGLAPVRGTVTYRGQPLAGAMVVFMPEQPGTLPASGLTDSFGRYELMTMTPGDGTTPGKYVVTITAREPDQAPAGDGSLIGAEVPLGKPLIPEKYFAAETSGLTAEVKPGGITADFVLKES